MRVSIVGTGYVGLVTGVCLAEKGHQVVCVDLDEGKVARLNRGQPTIREAGLDSLLKRHAGAGLMATTDLAAAVRGSDITLIAVGTPFDGRAIDLAQVKEAARGIGAALKGRSGWHTVVVKSTVVPGTTDDVVAPILEKESARKAGRDFGVGMNPEFLTEGEAVGDFMEPDRLVLGARDVRSMAALEELYAGFPGVPLIRTNPKTAEMIKYASNTLLATLISWSNEIANLGAALGGIDAMEVVEGVRSSRYLSQRAAPAADAGWDPASAAAPIADFLVPGCGFGGSCLPKDTAALIAQGRAVGSPMRILEAVRDVNESQPRRMIALLEKQIPDLKGMPVAVLGLAFRPGTGDLRESPAIPIIRELLARGAKVQAFDPAIAEEIAEAEAAPAGSQERSRGAQAAIAPFDGAVRGTHAAIAPLDGAVRGAHAAVALFEGAVRICPTLEEALDGARAALVVTRWPEFRRLPDLLDTMDFPPLVVDGRRMLDPDRIAHYEGIGL